MRIFVIIFGRGFVFFMGDFNYRTENIIEINYSISNTEILLKQDQMYIEQIKGRLDLKNFLEGKIKFSPTYKYIPGTNNFSLKENNPGWTDRIL